MAKEPKLKVDGAEVHNLLEVSYSIEMRVDRDGRPARGILPGGIRIVRIGDGKTTLADWAKDPTEKNRKSGEIEFTSDTGKPMKKLTWKNGFVHTYDLRYEPRYDPHDPEGRKLLDHHVVEEVVIHAEEIACGGLKVNLNWSDRA